MQSQEISNMCIVGSVVECSPATRAARVRFPDDANNVFVFIGQDQYVYILYIKWMLRPPPLKGFVKKSLETGGIDPPTSHMLSERSTI